MGKTHIVKPTDSIQEVIDRAQPGDSVKLPPGLWKEPIKLPENSDMVGDTIYLRNKKR